MSLRRKIGSILMICWGILLTGGALISIDKGDYDNSLATELVLMSLFGVLPLVAGVWFFWDGQRKAKSAKINHTQVSLLRHAQTANGRITITEAALVLGQSVSSAKSILDEMQSKGIFEIAITDEGTLEYVICQTLDRIEPQEGSSYV